MSASGLWVQVSALELALELWLGANACKTIWLREGPIEKALTTILQGKLCWRPRVMTDQL